jgi:hypothetical protein
MKLLIDECLPRTLKRLLGDPRMPNGTGDGVVWVGKAQDLSLQYMSDVAAALRLPHAATKQRLAELDVKAKGICEAIRLSIPSPQRANDGRIDVIAARQTLLLALQTK